MTAPAVVKYINVIDDILVSGRSAENTLPQIPPTVGQFKDIPGAQISVDLKTHEPTLRLPRKENASAQ